MSGPLRTEIVTALGRLEAFANDWDRLWRGNPRRSVFTAFPWRRAAWRGSREALFSPVVFRGDRVEGILPLGIEGSRLRFLGGSWADYSDLLVARGAEREVVAAALAALLEAPSPWSECLLENLPEDAAFLAGLAGIDGPTRAPWHLAPGAVCPTLLLGEDRKTTLDALIGKKSLRQREARLGKLGELRFIHLEDREEARRHLPGLFSQHAARWAMAGEASPFLRGDTRAFYEALVEELDPASDLRFSALLLDGRAVAYHLGFEVDGTFTLYKPTFDVDFWDHSPGDVLLRNLFAYVRSRPVREFDFTRGDEAYKSRFANHARQNRTFRLFRPGARGVVARVRLRARERLRETAWVDAPIRRLLSARARVAERLALPGRRRLRERLYSREELRVWVAPGNDRAEALASQVVVERSSLFELARLAAERFGFLDAERLATARSRLKRGETAWIARSKGGQGEEVYWSGPRAEVVLGPADSEDSPRLSFPRETTTIHDRWPLGRGLPPADQALALREIARRSGEGEIRLAAQVSPSTARDAGFRPTHRIGAVRLFGKLRRSWVRAEEEA